MACAAQVRSKALIQYTSPFISVDLRTMAAAFSADVECVAHARTNLRAFVRHGQLSCTLAACAAARSPLLRFRSAWIFRRIPCAKAPVPPVPPSHHLALTLHHLTLALPTASAGRARSALERELAELVAAKQVHARIDSHAKVLYARLADPRSATFANALRMGARQGRALVPYPIALLRPEHGAVQRACLSWAAAGRGCPVRARYGQCWRCVHPPDMLLRGNPRACRLRARRRCARSPAWPLKGLAACWRRRGLPAGHARAPAAHAAHPARPGAARARRPRPACARAAARARGARPHACMSRPRQAAAPRRGRAGVGQALLI